MKNKLFLLAGVFLLVSSLFGQSANTTPGTGHWVVIDSGYQVGTTTDGQTVAPLYFYNTSTSNNITGMQFRVKYDNTAFTGVVPSLKISTTSQVLNYTDDNTNGYLTVTLVYTGSSSSFNYSDGATFDLTFTHASAATWNTLDSIKTLKINNVSGWNDLASTSFGNDTTLVVYSYGGRFNQRVLRFVGMFFNTTGTNASNLYVSLEKKPKTGSTWTTVTSNKTDANGKIVFREFLDTTYWDTRMAVKGDTMTVGSIYSTADAQKINQVMLGTYTPVGFDYYTFDANGNDGTISITDVYAVYARLAGRFSEWPNSQEDVLFFTESEYNTINGSSTNYASTISGATNFTYYINGDDSVVYYVAAKGDANNTGFKKARLTPIKIINAANAKNYIIDKTVSYDNSSLETMEINMPKIKVEDGNLVNIPVKVLTNGKSLGALQLDLKYDTALLEFKKVELTEKMMKWTCYTNPSNGIVSWGGADLTNANMLLDGEQVFHLQFIAKRPQDSWSSAAIWTAEKYAGNSKAVDMIITPAMGVVEIRSKGKVSIKNIEDMIVFPNPAYDVVQVQFRIVEEAEVNLSLFNDIGQRIQTILDSKMPAGDYKYTADLERLPDGVYILTLKVNRELQNSKLLLL